MVLSSLILSVLIGLLPILLWVIIYSWVHKSNRGPRSWPIIGAVLEHASHLEDFYDYVTDYCRKYKTFRVSYPGYDYIYTANPANVEYMLKTNFPNYVKGRFAYEKQRELLGDGIFSVDGVEWKQQRKVASFEFSSKALKDFSDDAFRYYASKLAHLIIYEVKAHGHIEMQDLMKRMTFDSICKIGFGMEMGCLQENPAPEQCAFSKAFDNASGNVFWRYLDPFWRLKRWFRIGAEAQFLKDIQTLDNFMFNFIDRRKGELREVSAVQNSAVKPDLLSRFLALSEINPSEFSDRKIRDIILNFVIAGRDTTAVTLCWFFYLLTQNPHVEEKLVEEICSIETAGRISTDQEFPSDERIQEFVKLLTYDKLTKMNYLQACLSETLRLYPAVPVDSKIAKNSDKLPDGTNLKKGDSLNYVAYAMGRMEWIWGEDAQRFKPERFLKDGVYHQESPYKFTAFQAGPRICLGKDFAYLQMKVTAAVLLRFFEFHLFPGHKVQYRVLLTLHMKEDGLKLHVIPRTKTGSSDSSKPDSMDVKKPELYT